jgi:hypothetical protein
VVCRCVRSGTILGKALRDAEAQRFINRSPTLGVRKPCSKAEVSKLRTWTAELLRTFLELVADDRLYWIWMLASEQRSNMFHREQAPWPPNNRSRFLGVVRAVGLEPTLGEPTRS